MKKSCLDNLISIKKWNDIYSLEKILSKGTSKNALFGSGSYVYIIFNKISKKRYILKFFNKKNTRNIREIYMLCRLSGIRGVPKMKDFGVTTLPKEYGENLNSERLFYICEMINGKSLLETDILKFSKDDILFISFEILRILRRIRHRIGNFEHYDLNVGNIMIEETKQRPRVYIIDFEFSKNKQLHFLPDEQRWDKIKKGFFFNLFSRKLSIGIIKFLWKWNKSVWKIISTFINSKRIENTDIWNWFLISGILFDKSGIQKKIVSCKDIDDCIEKNFKK